MDSSHSAFEWTCITLTAGVALLQAYIAGTLLARKLRTNFPIFFLYLCFNAIGVMISIPAHAYMSDNQYYYFYWSSSFINTGLEFGVMFEILVNALKPYSALIDLGKMLFRWAAIFLLFAGVLTALVTAGGQPSKVAAAVALLERSTRLMQCGLLLLFFFLEKRLGLSWRNYNMSIALGLGSTAALDLSFSYLRVQFPARTETLSIIESAFFMSVLVFWAYCLKRPEPSRNNVLDSPSRLIFQRWNEALTSYTVRGEIALASSGVNSFLPGVEETVDRVMARKMVQ